MTGSTVISPILGSQAALAEMHQVGANLSTTRFNPAESRLVVLETSSAETYGVDLRTYGSTLNTAEVDEDIYHYDLILEVLDQPLTSAPINYEGTLANWVTVANIIPSNMVLWGNPIAPEGWQTVYSTDNPDETGRSSNDPAVVWTGTRPERSEDIKRIAFIQVGSIPGQTAVEGFGFELISNAAAACSIRYQNISEVMGSLNYAAQNEANYLAYEISTFDADQTQFLPSDQPIADNISPATPESRLSVRPQVRVDYAYSGAGVDGTAGVRGFVPLAQTVGQDVLFTEGSLTVDHGGNLGSQILLGYRSLNGNATNILGGHIGLQTRATGDNTFTQLDVGLESLGETVDIRVDGFVPLGNSRQAVGSASQQVVSDSTNGAELIQNVQQQQAFESALGGVNLDVGVRLGSLRDGPLRGHGGVYWLSGGGESTLGARAGLTATPVENANVGLAVQYDGMFGTNVAVNVGYRFGGSSQSATETCLANRLGESTAVGLPGSAGMGIQLIQRVETSTIQQITPIPEIEVATVTEIKEPIKTEFTGGIPLIPIEEEAIGVIEAIPPRTVITSPVVTESKVR